MSTKDIIERLNRTNTTRRAGGGEGGGVGDKRQTTRVGARVIRRRRVAPGAKPAVPTAAEALASGAPVEEAPTPEVEVAPESAAAPVEEAPAEEVKEKAPAKKKAAAKKKAPAKKKAAAKKKDETPEEAPVVEAAPEEAPAEEAPAVEAATEEAATEEAPAEEAPAVEAATEEAATEEAPKEAAEGSDEAAAEAEAVAPSPDIAAGLPRADGSPGKPNLPRLGGTPKGTAFPGLGSAVVRPPPGYDPANPEATRKAAAKEAEKTSATPGKQWRDERSGPGRGRRDAGATTLSEEEQRRQQQRPRRAGRRRARVEMQMDDFPARNRGRRRRTRSAGPKKASPQAKAIKRRVELDGTITVTNLAHGMSVKAGQVIKALIDVGQMATANDELDLETAQLVAEQFEYEVVDKTFHEQDHMIQVEEVEEDPNQVTRPPVVTIMGHVDHGKTTLLDTIRKANVAAGEAGGITQHTAAYQVEHQGQLITFLDTPGHEAFTEMRSRGAQVTDIVILVVAADDGIMPQTVEAINHSKAAGVQILVAVNKCDKPGVNPDTVRQSLMEHELVPEEYGGDTIMCNVSALKGDGLDDLLANILLVAELGEYAANPDRHADGSVLEARLEKGRGPVATVLVQAGTLNQGDSVVLGTVWGRVRAMADFNGNPIKSAGPSSPVEIIGLQDVPKAGDNMAVVKDDRAARALADHRADLDRAANMDGPIRVTLEDLLAQAEEGEKVTLNLIVKADVGGTLEAMKNSVDKLDVPGTDVKLLHSAVGAISESDITLAHTYGTVVIGFNVRPDAKARRAADQNGVEVRTYSVIYEALEDIEKALKGLLKPTIKETLQGTAEVRETFNVPKIGTAAGCRVMEGTIARPHLARLLRDGIVVWDGKLASLRRFKDDVKTVEKGYECGIRLDGFNDIKAGDVIETFTQEEVSPLDA